MSTHRSESSIMLIASFRNYAHKPVPLFLVIRRSAEAKCRRHSFTFPSCTQWEPLKDSTKTRRPCWTAEIDGNQTSKNLKTPSTHPFSYHNQTNYFNSPLLFFSRKWRGEFGRKVEKIKRETHKLNTA